MYICLLYLIYLIQMVHFSVDMPLVGTRALTDTEFAILRTRLPSIMDAITPLLESVADAAAINSIVPGQVTYFTLADVPSIVKRMIKLATAFTQLFSTSVSIILDISKAA